MVSTPVTVITIHVIECSLYYLSRKCSYLGMPLLQPVVLLLGLLAREIARRHFRYVFLFSRMPSKMRNMLYYTFEVRQCNSLTRLGRYYRPRT